MIPNEEVGYEKVTKFVVLTVRLFAKCACKLDETHEVYSWVRVTGLIW